MNIRFRPLVRWPFPDTSHRRSRRTFSAGWTNTLARLHRELDHLGAEAVVVQADFSEDDLRLDGMPRANARIPSHPGVILNFESRHGPLQYATDTHEFWQHNVRAIALGLEALRAVDRYGITRSGEQYKGWRQLTAGSGLTSREQAIDLLQRLTGFVDTTPDPNYRQAYKAALKKAHPDLGGSPDLLAQVREAGRLLGVS